MGAASAAPVRSLNVTDGGDATRVVLEMPTAATVKLFTLDHPDRVVLDLHGVGAGPKFPAADVAHGVVRGVRQAPQADGLRIVFDVSSPVVAKSFTMPPAPGFGSRLIVELARSGAARTSLPQASAPPAASPATPEPAATHPATQSTSLQPSPPLSAPGMAASADASGDADEPVSSPAAPAPRAVVEARAAAVSPQVTALPSPSVPGTPAPSPMLAAVSPLPVQAVEISTPAARPVAEVAPVGPVANERAMHAAGKPLVVAIDAGHGGYDPGAHGFAGVNEKDVCLAMARKLAALVDAEPGMRAVLTRDGDYYVGLRERMDKARTAQADVFVSIHANSYKERSMHGAAVYVVSPHGATSEQARWIANRENEADLVGGVDLQKRDDQVAAVLVDISQSATVEASFDLAGRMMNALRDVTVMQKPVVQQAGFMVLKAPDIPSILIETAYITNAEEERDLNSDDFQSQMARAMLQGLRGYFDNYRPRQTPPVETAERVPGPQPVSLKRNRSDD